MRGICFRTSGSIAIAMSSSRNLFFELIVDAIASPLNRQHKEPGSQEADRRDVRRIDSTSRLEDVIQQGDRRAECREISATRTADETKRRHSSAALVTAWSSKPQKPGAQEVIEYSLF